MAAVIALILTVVLVTSGDDDSGTATDRTDRTDDMRETDETDESDATERTDAADTTEAPDTTAVDTADTAEPPAETAATADSVPAATDFPPFDEGTPKIAAAVCQTVTFAEGSLGRVNSIEYDIEALGEFAEPAPAGSVYVRASISVCANSVQTIGPPTGYLADGDWATDDSGGLVAYTIDKPFNAPVEEEPDVEFVGISSWVFV